MASIAVSSSLGPGHVVVVLRGSLTSLVPPGSRALCRSLPPLVRGSS